IATASLSLTSCQPARLDCRFEDPGCSDSALLAMLQVLTSPLYLYWGDMNTNTIYRLEDGSETYESFLNLGAIPYRFGFTSDAKTLFVSNGTAVYSVTMSDKSYSQISNVFSDVNSLVVVEKEGKIYYSDNGSGQVDTTNLDGSGYANVHNPGSNGGMDIDEINDFQYIANSSQIVRYNMDGSGATTVVSSTGLNVNDVELDDAGQRLFWVDQSNGELRRANIDGSNEQLLVSSIGSGTGVAFHPSSPYLYYCDAGIQSIVRTLRDGSSPLIVATAMACRDVDFAPVAN
ncbi:MAG: hypothetical protein KDK33_06230, partial [Leptospiraceae bacterium]|nr:hypothetical protein [Leptospiraceae bacterium]